MKLLAHLGGQVVGASVTLLQTLHQPLKLGSHGFLLLGVAHIAVQEGLPHQIALPWRRVVDLLLFGRVVKLAAFLAFQEKQVHLDVVVGQTRLTGHAHKTADAGQHHHQRGGNGGVGGRVADAQPAELYRVVVVETHHKGHIDGQKPHKTGHTVQDAAQTALLARQTGQLTVGAVENVGPYEQEKGDEIVQQSFAALIVIAAVGEKHTAAGTDYHRQNGHRVGMNTQTGKQKGPQITEGAHHMIVEPVFRLGRLQCGGVFLVHRGVSARCIPSVWCLPPSGSAPCGPG